MATARPLTQGELETLVGILTDLNPGEVGGWAVIAVSKNDQVRLSSGPLGTKASCEYLFSLGLRMLSPATPIERGSSGA